MIYNALSPMKAKNLVAGKYADSQGLWLFKRSKIAGKWILRLTVDGKRREIGLGPWPDVAIAEARERAAEARRQLRDRIDPIRERQLSRQKAKCLTVADAVKSCFEARQAQLRGDGKAGRWMSPLSTHIAPVIGNIAIEEIDQHVLKRVLEPIWHDKPDSARKAMNRINLTLRHAAALGLDVDLQSTMKARALLGKQRHDAQHIPSMPYTEAPAFYRLLRGKPHMSCIALRFLMLSALRTSELRFARRADIVGDVLIVPAAHTKSGSEHRLPLTDEVRTVIAEANTSSDQQLLFPSPTGNVMSNSTMARFMEREGLDYRPHGFRATFRTWAEERTDAEYEVKETALAHKVGSNAERAYQRSDLLDKRKALLQKWGDYLSG